jgi:hypothetical protein
MIAADGPEAARECPDGGGKKARVGLLIPGAPPRVVGPTEVASLDSADDLSDPGRRARR